MRIPHRLVSVWKSSTRQARRIVSATVLTALVITTAQLGSAFAAPPTMSISSQPFKLSGVFSNAGNIQQGAGSFANGSLADYPEGSCVPVLFEVKNTTSAAADMSVSPVFDYMNGVVGLADLQRLTTTLTGSQIEPSADNLNDFAVTGASLNTATSFTTAANGTVAAAISGPYSGNSSGTSATTATDAFRHYNISLDDVPAGGTVNVLFCGRLGVDASEYNGASLSVRIAGGTENIPIQVNQLLELPSLTLSKTVASGSALPEAFSFTVSPAINSQSNYSIPSGSDTVVIENVMPDGTYVVTETGPSGYQFLSGSGTSCTFNGSVATATLAAGKPATNGTCAFTNEAIASPAQATLTVTKVVVNDDAGSSSVGDFLLSVGSTSVTSGVSATFAPGSYVVSESGAAGYVATFSGDCDANGNVSLADGDDKSCTITNDDVHVAAATLTVTKVVVNDDAGSSSVGDFPLFVGNTSVSSGSPSTFAPGSYVVTESTQGGYVATYSGDCDANGNVSLADGDDKTCTITNNDIALPPPPPPEEDPLATLTVTKVVVNDDDGTSSISSFPLFVGNDSVTSGQANDFAPGSYVVTESNQGGYTATFSGDCDADGNITLVADESKTCTITNDDVHVAAATLTVTKVVVNDDTGTSEVSDFPLFVGNVSVTSGQSETFVPGDYVVTESNQSGYTATYSGDCDANGNVSLADGDDKTCTITNDDVTPAPTPDPEATLTVVKVVVNNDDGDSEVSDFPLSVGQVSVTSGVAATFAPGSYLVSESGASGYVATFSGDCDAQGNITIADGDNKTCTITNDDVTPPPPPPTQDPDPTLTVTVVVQNGYGGTLSPGNVSIWVEQDVPEEEDGPLTFIVRSLANVFVKAAYAAIGINLTSGVPATLAPGSYTVLHSSHSGYTATFSGDCTAVGGVLIPLTGSKSCVLTLTQNGGNGGGGGGGSPQPTITVVTLVVNDDGGTLLPSGVLMTVGDGTSVNSTFGGFNAPGLTVSQPAGAYLVDGASAAGYSKTATSSCTGTLSSGQNVTCTVTYNDIPAVTPPPTPPTPPTPIVLGATNTAPPVPIVLGETDSSSETEELPRTGTAPIGLLPLIIAAAAIAVRRRR